MRVPGYNERMSIINQIQSICKSKGKKFNGNIETIYKDIRRQYPFLNKTFDQCLKSNGNITKEMVKWAHVGAENKDKRSVKYFKKFLQLIVKATKKAIFITNMVIRNIYKNGTKSLPDYLVLLITTFIFLGVAGACIVLYMGMWRITIGNQIDAVMDKSQKIKKGWKTVKTNVFGKDVEDSSDILPDDLEPPNFQEPNLSITTLYESENLSESMEIAAGILFVILFKAAVAHSFNEEMKQKTHILSSLIKPSGAIMFFLVLSMYLGAGSAATIVNVA